MNWKTARINYQNISELYNLLQSLNNFPKEFKNLNPLFSNIFQNLLWNGSVINTCVYPCVHMHTYKNGSRARKSIYVYQIFYVH